MILVINKDNKNFFCVVNGKEIGFDKSAVLGAAIVEKAGFPAYYTLWRITAPREMKHIRPDQIINLIDVHPPTFVIEKPPQSMH